MTVGKGFAAAVCLALVGVAISLSAADKPKKKKKKPVQPATPDAPVAEIKPTKEGLDFFEKKIRPVLVAQCYQCHAATATKVKGGLLLDTRDGLRKGGESGAAIVAGHPEDSLLIEAIKYDGLEMPPKQKLPDSVIADFVKWVEMGAPDPRDGKAATVKREINLEEAKKYWAFQPPHKHAPPKVKDVQWAKTDIDRFVQAKWDEKSLVPVADADRVTLIRRATFDLVGLPPRPEEIDTFVSDKSPEAFAKVIDRLLASPQFGERWGRHWLDVARYGESTGKERNVLFRYAWRYRDYVIDAFNADKPYDRFVREQIAGDLLPAKDDAERNVQLVATGFLALGPKGLNEKNAEQYVMDVVDEQIDVTTRAILGTTVGCARCHDHKFDPIPTSDYYALAGIFRSTATFDGVKRGSRNSADSELMQLASIKPEASAQALEAAKANREEISRLEEELVQLQTRRKQLQKAQKNPEKKKKKLEAAAAAAGEAEEAKPAAQLKQINKRAKEIQGRLAELGSQPAAPGELVMAVRDAKKPADCTVLIRGEINERGPSVPRGFVSVLKTAHDPKINPDESGRLELAQWLTSRENPLTARVMVNRIWQHLFGAGIVGTTDNFGNLGEKPTHPELLDQLAVQFMDQGWSVKKMIRVILLSRVYQLSSDFHDANDDADAENQWLWRANRRRLDAEAIRDATLAASGRLDLKRPEGSVILSMGTGEVGRGLDLKALAKVGNARSVYLPYVRGVMPEMLTVFDVADPSLVVAQREVTTVPTQALYMMNAPFVMEQAEQTAKRVLEKPGLGDVARINLAYRLALGRVATTAEQARVADYLKQYRETFRENSKPGTDAGLAAWTSFCQTLFASAEFRYVY